MKFLTLAFFSGTALAFFTSWGNSSSTRSGGGIGVLHHFNGTDTTSSAESNSRSKSTIVTKDETNSETKTTIITQSPFTVTGFTTFCPSSTLLTITTCNHDKCVPTTITVGQASTVTITEVCLVQNTETASVVLHHIPPPPSPITKTSEYTVTELITFCPQPTVFTYTRCVHGNCQPAVHTVTEATTITISETCIVLRTLTESATITPQVALHTHHDDHTYHHAVLRTVTKVIQSTVTDSVTACPSPTEFTIIRFVNHIQTLSAVTVTDATTITLFGTCIVPVTITEVVTLTASPGEAGAFAIAVSEATVTHLETFIPQATIVTVTKCVNHACAPILITVTEVTTLTLKGTLIVTIPITQDVFTTSSLPEVNAFAITVFQVTVTEFETFVPAPSTLSITTCNEGICAPSLITITKATTVTLSGHLFVPSTVTNEVITSTEIPENVLFGVTTTESTVTELSTVVSESTVLSATTCSGISCTITLITIQEPTTLVFPGTFVVQNSAALNGVASEGTSVIGAPTQVDSIIFSSTEIATIAGVSEDQDLSTVTVTGSSSRSSPDSNIITPTVVAVIPSLAGAGEQPSFFSVSGLESSPESIISRPIEIATIASLAEVNVEQVSSSISVTGSIRNIINIGSTEIASTPSLTGVNEEQDSFSVLALVSSSNIINFGPTEVATIASLAGVNEEQGSSFVSGLGSSYSSRTPPAASLFQNQAARNLAGIFGILGFAALLF